MTKHIVNTHQEVSFASLWGLTQGGYKAVEAGEDGAPSQDDKEDSQQVLGSKLGKLQEREGLGSKGRDEQHLSGHSGGETWLTLHYSDPVTEAWDLS